MIKHILGDHYDTKWKLKYIIPEVTTFNFFNLFSFLNIV